MLEGNSEQAPDETPCLYREASVNLFPLTPAILLLAKFRNRRNPQNVI